MLLQITALDAYFFRDARPFTAGDSHQAASIFPPSPLTVQGMLRSVLLARQLASQGCWFDDYAAPPPAAAPPGGQKAAKSRGRELSANTSARLAQLRKIFGDADGYGGLSIRGPVVYRSGTADPTQSGLWFPTPLDTVQSGQRGGAAELWPLQPLRPGRRLAALSAANPCLGFAGGLTPLGLAPAGAGAEVDAPAGAGAEVDAPAGAHVRFADLVRLLAGVNVPAPKAPAPLAAEETRVGIQRGADRGATPGMLYTARVIRPADGVALLVDAITPNDQYLTSFRKALARFGGDGHAAVLEQADPGATAHWQDLAGGAQRQHLQEMVARSEGRRLKLYLATPAVFARGWLPDGIDATTGHIVLAGYRYRLVAAAAGKPAYVGGWNLRARRPRPLLAATPAGSAYCFEAVAGAAENANGIDVNTLFHRLHWQAFPVRQQADDETAEQWESRRGLAQIGFGLTLIGGWEYV